MPINPFEELVSCQKSFVYFVENYVKIRHPVNGLIPFKLHDFQKRFAEVLDGDNRFVIGKKFRQGGFSTINILFALWKCMFFQNQQIVVISKTSGMAKHLSQLIDGVNFSLPKWFPVYEKLNQVFKFPSTESNLLFRSASFNMVKGISATHIILDEPAFIPDMDKLWKVLWPMCSDNAKVTAMSTTNGVDGWFWETYWAAVEKTNNFHVFESSYLEHPFYTEEQITLMRKQLGEKGFLQEVLCEFCGEEPDFVCEENHKLSDKELTLKVSQIIHKVPFREKGLIWEICQRYSKKIAK